MRCGGEHGFAARQANEGVRTRIRSRGSCKFIHPRGFEQCVVGGRNQQWRAFLRQRSGDAGGRSAGSSHHHDFLADAGEALQHIGPVYRHHDARHAARAGQRQQHAFQHRAAADL